MGVEFEELERFIFNDFNEDAGFSNDFETFAFIGNNVKCSLKSKILERRRSLGLGEITIDFSPKEIYPMTEVEKEKDRKRKESNRISAKKCREKQKEEYKRNKMLLEQLKDDQDKLLSKVKEMEEEKNKVLFALKKRLPDSYIVEILKQANHSKLDESDGLEPRLECSGNIEKAQMLQNADQDTLHTRNERTMHEEEISSSDQSLFLSIIGTQDTDIPTADNFVIENDNLLLSLFR